MEQSRKSKGKIEECDLNSLALEDIHNLQSLRFEVNKKESTDLLPGYLFIFNRGVSYCFSKRIVLTVPSEEIVCNK
jgi:hypothetical protein